MTVVVGDGEAETGPLADLLALQQIPQSGARRRRAADSASEWLQDCKSHHSRPASLGEELVCAADRIRPQTLFCRRRRPTCDAPANGSTMEQCITEIRSIQQHARSTGDTARPRWPMIVLALSQRLDRAQRGRRPQGRGVLARAPGSGVSIRLPISGDLQIVEDWMRSYKPEELFDAKGTLVPDLQELAPSGTRRISANPHANGGLLRKDTGAAGLPRLCRQREGSGCHLRSPHRRARPLFARGDAPQHDQLPRLWSRRNRLQPAQAIYEPASKKTWLAEIQAGRRDGGELDLDGRVMEMLSEHTLEGWFEGYVLTGRHGFFSSLRGLCPHHRFHVQPAR